MGCKKHAPLDKDCNCDTRPSKTGSVSDSPELTGSMPWDKYENKEDGAWSCFGAWQKWMDEKHEAILDGIEQEETIALYVIMCDLVQA